MNVKYVLDSLNLDQIRTDLATHYHTDGPGRNPINPLSMLKAQLAKHLLQIPSDWTYTVLNVGEPSIF